MCEWGIKVVGSEIQKKETAYYKTYKLMQTTERKICACLEMVSYRMFSSENKKKHQPKYSFII